MPAQNLLAKIHIAKKDLKLTDPEYRAILLDTTKKESSKDMSDYEAEKVIIPFKELGWQPKYPSGARRQRKNTTYPSSPVIFSAAARSRPSDGGDVVTPEQQECLEAFRLYLDWDRIHMQDQAEKIIKIAWPQTRKQGVDLTMNLTFIFVERILRDIRALDTSQLTPWERGFLYFNQPNALGLFGEYVKNKNKRGHRTMPKCSFLKLFEILRAQPSKTSITLDAIIIKGEKPMSAFSLKRWDARGSRYTRVYINGDFITGLKIFFDCWGGKVTLHYNPNFQDFPAPFHLESDPAKAIADQALMENGIGPDKYTWEELLEASV